jgi:hypothetical protein
MGMVENRHWKIVVCNACLDNKICFSFEYYINYYKLAKVIYQLRVGQLGQMTKF